MELWEYREHTREELNQRRAEGASIADGEAEHARLVAGYAEDVEAWRSFYHRFFDEPYDAADNPSEPSSLDAIQALRSSASRTFAVDETALPDRILGAWHGRIAGCVLGKPMEAKPKSYIDKYLAAAGQDDLNGFFPFIDPTPEDLDPWWWSHEWVRDCTEGRIHIAERDDDIDYTILGLHYVEKYGPEFTAANVAAEWLALLPFHTVFTAERVAYRNLVNGFQPPDTATFRNPYREWIGAQIRADAFGYVNAGHPGAAAAMAFRDASVSHTRNGIYGEIWSAATVAAAFGASSVREALGAGLAEIPPGSRLAEVGRKALAWHAEYPTWEACWSRAREDYGHLHWVHTLNNAMWVMIGLLYGDGDFGRTIAIAVRCGDDTDCNGATAGSILGALLGASALPDYWKTPFNDRVRSAVLGFDNSSITELARRTYAQYERVRDART